MTQSKQELAARNVRIRAEKLRENLMRRKGQLRAKISEQTKTSELTETSEQTNTINIGQNGPETEQAADKAGKNSLG